MTETGSTVERLREQMDRIAPDGIVWLEFPEARAVLAVVEAAQEVSEMCRPLSLVKALVALHSQASDEGEQ